MMFTGIVQGVGKIAVIGDEPPAVTHMRIEAGTLDLGDVKVGASIAVDGVCLTAVAITGGGFSVDVSRETLARTTLGHVAADARVNLEKSLRLESRLGGHLVSGHVDGVGTVLQREDDAGSVRLLIQAPDDLARYIGRKGSVCIDGVSLTVNAVKEAAFELQLIPHTLQVTTAGRYRVGTRVNIEVDLIARYLERLLASGPVSTSATTGITREFLAEHGYLSDAGD